MCRRADPSEGVGFLVTLIYAASWAMMMTRWKGPRTRAIEVWYCKACDYDLAGLERGARCPECGDPTPHVRITRTGNRLTWHGPRLAKWFMAFPAWMLLFSMFGMFTEPLVALSYRVQGYGWETSVRAARCRELAEIGDSINGVLVTLWPFAVAMLLSVLVVHLRTRLWLRVTLVLMLCGVLGSLAIWTLPYAWSR